jgi:hypothetical protein
MVAVRQQVTERDLSKGMARANSRYARSPRLPERRQSRTEQAVLSPADMARAGM